MAATHYENTSALIHRVNRAAKSKDRGQIQQEIDILEGAIREWEVELEQPSSGVKLRLSIARRCQARLEDALGEL